MKSIQSTGNTASSFWHSLARTSIIGLVAILFLAMIIGGTALLHLRAYSGTSISANPPLTVTTKKIKTVEKFLITESFAGRIEPKRETQLSFERSGLILEIFIDEGDAVSQGAVISELDVSKLNAQRAELEAQQKEFEAQLELANLTLKRQSNLQNRGWATDQAFDEARFRVSQLEASIERVKANLKNLDIDLEKSELKAPFSGTIADRFVDEGSVINVGTPVVKLLESGEKHIRVGVSPEAAQNLLIGNVYTFQSSGKTYTAELISRRPDLEAGTRTVTLLFTTDQAELIPFGEIFELKLGRMIEKPGAWLPVSALSEGQKGLWTVFTVEDKNNQMIVARRSVKILHTEADRVFVQSRLQDGTRVILNGTNRVIPGQQVALAQEN